MDSRSQRHPYSALFCPDTGRLDAKRTADIDAYMDKWEADHDGFIDDHMDDREAALNAYVAKLSEAFDRELAETERGLEELAGL